MLNRYLSVIFLAWIAVACAVQAAAQSITSGAVTGVVTDPAHAAVPNASVTLTDEDTAAVQKATTSGQGTYRFAFIKPGIYKVSVSAAGFGGQQRGGIVVTPGQPIAADFQLQISGVSTTVEVAEAGAVLQTENADATTHYSAQQIENLPNPGGDITYIAQTAPGVVMNTQAGYGNFVADGMPGTSNLFTVNGVNDNDPFFGINNSGASNLLLGSNDIAEANVINNAYSAQYGQYAGSQITYITKSGENTFHGDAVYNWNGRALNANQFFSNSSGLPRPFNNFNQWQTNLSGPIWKNHTFFDVDYEGLRNVLPTAAGLNQIPSPQFEAATLANLAGSGNAAEIPFYQKIFTVYDGAPGAAGAMPVADGGCQGFTGLPAGVPCALQFRRLNALYAWAPNVKFTRSNHTNFDQPVADISNPQFGSSIAAVGPPTSLLGSFVGAGSSPRFVEIKGVIRF
jgi:Carboxypeptidase regulatory-like domain/TonB-dependent Receptor Plug Domain